MIAVLNMISLNIVHQKLFYITGICIFSVHVKDKSTAQHVLPEQKDNGSSSFAGKTYKFQLHNSFLVWIMHNAYHKKSQKQINKTNRFALF
jgi:hypothetical protein